MGFTGIITKIAATASIGLASVSGVKTVVEIVKPPAIEAVASYPKSVKAGETVMVNWQITKRTDCRGMQSRIWNGENGFYLVEASRQTGLPATGELEIYNIPTAIPESAPYGELLLTVKGVYFCEGGDVPFEIGPAILEVIK